MEGFLRFIANCVAILFAVYLFFGFQSIHNKLSPTADLFGFGKSAMTDMAANTRDLFADRANRVRQISVHRVKQPTQITDIAKYKESNTDYELTGVDLLAIPSLFPVKGKVEISSGFGYRSDPFTGKKAFHNGIDIPLRTGHPVYAAGNGLVVDAGYDRFLGNYVEIKHALGYSSIYGHLSRVAVQENQQVNAGDLIANSGNSGRSTGPHLHYQVNYHGLPVDPVSLKKIMKTALSE